MRKGYAEREEKRARRALLRDQIAAKKLELAGARMKGAKPQVLYTLRTELAHLREQHHDLRQRRRRRDPEVSIMDWFKG